MAACHVYTYTYYAILYRITLYHIVCGRPRRFSRGTRRQAGASSWTRWHVELESIVLFVDVFAMFSLLLKHVFMTSESVLVPLLINTRDWYKYICVFMLFVFYVHYHYYHYYYYYYY